MIEYINGKLTDLTPTCAVIETNGIGYAVNIPLITYSELQGKETCKLYVYEAIREDAHLLYGFPTKAERELFLLLISVSGVGANTARVIMSYLTPKELQEAIACENYSIIQNIKGIGLKTAQRIVVDLKDKILKTSGLDELPLFHDNGIRGEALSALVTLGFNQSVSQKALDKVFKENSSLTVEQAIKAALKAL